MADKTTVIAKTVIHRTVKPGQPGDKAKGVKPIRPEIQVIRPGARFVTKDKAEFDELLKAGAITVATDAEAEKPAAAAAAAAASTTEKPRKAPAKKAAAKDDGGDSGKTGGDGDGGDGGDDLV